MATLYRLASSFIQGNNKEAIEAVTSDCLSLGVQVSFDSVMHVLYDEKVEANVKTIYIGLLQG